MREVGVLWRCKDSGGVTVTLFRNAFLVGAFNHSHEISEHSQGQLWQ